MKRLHRATLVALSCGLMFPMVSLAQPAGSDQGETDQQTAQQAINPSLLQAADNFWHYAKVARYDLANQAAGEVLKHSSMPTQVLLAFEKVSSDRNDNLDEWMLRWQQIPQLTKSVDKINDVLNKGRYARRSNPKYILRNIQRLNVNERAYSLAIAQLRNSGELAVPLMLDYLRDPSKKEYYAGIQRALRDLGREALNPLLASTQMKDPGTLIMVINALGDIGYDVTVPYLCRLAKDADEPDPVRMAAKQALTNMGAGDALNKDPGQLFYDLGLKFYYNTAAIQADTRLPVANMWYWSEDSGLTRKQVPPQIFNDLMAMRQCIYAMKLDPKMSQALSLWLSANYTREADLKPGQTDPTRQPNQPDANYYGVAAGAQYVNAVLSRALKDHNTNVALRAVRSLNTILGASNMFSGHHGRPIIQAMSYSDRQVRFEAAMAVAQALPQHQFMGQDRVVPILADALTQSAEPNVLVILPSQNDINQIEQTYKGVYKVEGATNVAAAINLASGLTSVDVIVLSEDLPAAEITKLFDMAQNMPQLSSAARLIITHSTASPYAQLTLNDPMVSITQISQPKDLKSAIEQARQRAGSTTMSPEMTQHYADRAADLLWKLAISRGQVLDLSGAEPALLSELGSSRVSMVKTCGQVLALLNSKTAQNGLMDKASNESTPDALKISLYNSLATSAKFWGNLLTPDSVEALQKVVEGAPNLKVRSAAAEARGALNLPADEAQNLILKQARM